MLHENVIISICHFRGPISRKLYLFRCRHHRAACIATVFPTRKVQFKHLESHRSRVNDSRKWHLALANQKTVMHIRSLLTSFQILLQWHFFLNVNLFEKNFQEIYKKSPPWALWREFAYRRWFRVKTTIFGQFWPNIAILAIFWSFFY